MKYKKEILAIIFLLTSIAILLVNTLLVPREDFAFRTLLDGLALIIFPIVIATLSYKKSKTFSYAFISWAIGMFLWRIWNLTGKSALPPFIADIFFIIFNILIITYLFKEIKLRSITDYIITIILLTATYFAFIFNQAIGIETIYGVGAGLIASFGLASFTRNPSSFNIGLFFLGAAQAIYVYALQVDAYYVAGWIDFMYLLSLFIITFGLMERHLNK